MISKKKTAVIIIIAMIVSSVSTFAIMTFVPFQGKVLITEQDYINYKYILKEYGKLFELRQYIEEFYYVPVDGEKLKTGMYKGLFKGTGDKYSAYFTKEEYDEIMLSTQGEYQGIGVIVTPAEDGYITVVAPFEDTPAHRAGIISGDKIVKIDGEEYNADQLNLAVSKMRGEPGTSVHITIMRDGEDSLIELDILRANVKMKSVKSEMLDSNIGYIRITSFDDKTSDEFKNHLRDLQLKNIEGLVIDLRDNPGGLVNECLEIADMLMGKDVIVYTEDGKGNKEYHESDRDQINIPYAILVNGGSASSSEILSAGVKDAGAGTLIGTQTYGKGIIQRIVPLNDGDGIELTVAQYFSPKGNSIHGIGVEPDIIVEIDYEQLEDGILTKENDPQLMKALEVLYQQIY